MNWLSYGKKVACKKNTNVASFRTKPCTLPQSPLSIDLILPEDDMSISSLPTEASQLEEIMKVQQLRVRESYNRSKRKEMCGKEEVLYQSVATDEEIGASILLLRSEVPKYNFEFMSWMLNFSGRARVPSRENFILSECVEEEYFEQEDEVEDYCNCAKAGSKRVVMAHYKVKS